MPRSEKQDAAYKNPDNDPRGQWTTRGFVSAELLWIRDVIPLHAIWSSYCATNGMYWRGSREHLAKRMLISGFGGERMADNAPRSSDSCLK